MDNPLFVNILRGTVSTVLTVMLMFSLVEFKCSKRVTYISLVIISTLKMIGTTYFYVFHDLTTLVPFDVVMWLILGLVCKLLSTDSMIKWLFNVSTVVNISIFIVIISYVVSRPFPYPMYVHTIIRIILYACFIILFKKFVYPLYRQVVDRWRNFLLVTVAITLNYIYILTSSQEITQGITENLRLLLLLSTLMFTVYGTIFWFFGSIIREYKFYNEKEQSRLQENLLAAQLKAYEEFVEVSKHHRHDLRHHNQIIMGYLKYGDVKGAEDYLCSHDTNIIDNTISSFCKNNIANAVLCMYEQKAKVEKIIFTVKSEIPQNINISQPKLGSILSNILENAIEACKSAKTDKLFITFTAEMEEDNLKIELINVVSERVEMKNDLPVSKKKNGGTGMKSVVHIVNSYNGMVYFSQKRDTFITQIIIPIRYI